jgi:hypothetical protein
MAIGVLLVVGVLVASCSPVRARSTAQLTVEPDAVLLAERHGVALDRDGRRLVAAWLLRARTCRSGWSIGAVVVGGAVMVTQITPGTISLLWVLGFGLAGSLTGTVRAELFRFRSPEGPREAMLERRRAADHRDRGSVLTRAGLTAMLLGCGAAAVAQGRLAASVAVAGAVVMLVLALATERAVAVRPRPALPDGLRAADDMVRGTAIRSLSFASRGLLALGTIATIAVWSPSTSVVLPAVLVLWVVAIHDALAARREARPTRAERRAAAIPVLVR